MTCSTKKQSSGYMSFGFGYNNFVVPDYMCDLHYNFVVTHAGRKFTQACKKKKKRRRKKEN